MSDPTAITLGAMTLPAGLRWDDEYASWSPVAQSTSYGLTGALLVQEAAKQAGRPLTLTGGRQYCWIARADLDTLVAAMEKIKDKGALLDAAPVICAGFKSDFGRVMFNGMGDVGDLVIPGWDLINCGDERGMLEAIKLWIDSAASSETCLVGHNSMGFDAPKLRNAFVRHRLPLPLCLRPVEPYQPMWDTMKKFRFYSAEHSDDFYVSLDIVAEAFGIERPKQNVSGAEVPRMHREGRYAEILVYCGIDVETTDQVYLAMTA